MSRPGPRRVTEIGAPESFDGLRHTRAAVVGSIALIGVLVLTGFGFKTSLEDADRRVDVADVEVPDLGGLTEQEALAVLEEADLIMVVEDVPNDLVAKGIVFAQRPIDGAIVEEGSPVTAVVSAGVAGPVVPETVGQQVVDAQATLGAAGITGVVEPVHSEDIRVGEVVNSRPPAGERTGEERTVTLEVSDGPAPRTVPEAVGRPAEEVLEIIGRQKLIPNVEYEHRPDATVGTVVSMDPPAGTQVPRGSEVSLVIAGPAPTVRVPAVVGLLENTAVQAMEAAGLSPVLRRVPIPAGDPRHNRIVLQGISVDSDVPRNTEVEIVTGIDQTPRPVPTTSLPPLVTTPPTSSPATTTTTTPSGTGP